MRRHGTTLNIIAQGTRIRSQKNFVHATRRYFGGTLCSLLGRASSRAGEAERGRSGLATIIGGSGQRTSPIITRLFAIVVEIRGKAPAERTAARRERAIPILDDAVRAAAGPKAALKLTFKLDYLMGAGHDGFALGEIVTEGALCPNFSATAAVVPEPQKKSATRSPSLLLALIIRSRSSPGFCVG